MSQISTLNAALSLADQNCLQPTDVLDLFRSFEFLKILAIDIFCLEKVKKQKIVVFYLIEERETMKVSLIIIVLVLVNLYCEGVKTNRDNRKTGRNVQPHRLMNSLKRDITIAEQNHNVLILHREKRTIFGFLSFLVLLLNAFLAINLNVNINNNNNNLNDNMNENMNENMNMN